MQTIHPQQASGALQSPRFVRAALGAALALSLSALAPAWAQQPPTQPAPVPGAGEAAARASVSGSGATTGAGSAPISATTMMRATGTSSTSNGSARSNRNKKNAAKTGAIEPWPGRRVLLLLPLQLGPGFNADRSFGQAILSRAEALLQEQLDATGKFSVIRAHRFSPLIQRALQEKRLTEAQADDAIKAPPDGSVAAATAFLKQFTFDQVPLIAQFNLEQVRESGSPDRPGVQAQVSGRLYELDNPVALKAPVMTSNTVTKGRNNIDRYLDAARLAFGDVATEFTAPLEDIALPRAEPAGVSYRPDATSTNGRRAVTNATPNARVPAATPAQPVAPDTSMGTGISDTAMPAATTASPAQAPDSGAAPGTTPPGTTAPGTTAPRTGAAIAPGTAAAAPAP